jgi:hypothetical protein
MALNLLDITANNNDLTNSGATEVTTNLPFAESSKAVDIDNASSQYLSAADSASLSLSGDFTIEFWIKFNSLPATGQSYAIVSKTDFDVSNNNKAFRVDFEKNALDVTRLVAEINETGNDTTRDLVRYNWAPDLDTWYHVAVTCDISQASATTFEIFINGSSVGNGTMAVSGNCASINNSTEPLHLGRARNGASYIQYGDFKLDDIRIWNDIRTPTEIANNYNVELVGNEANLVTYWPFEAFISGPVNLKTYNTNATANIKTINTNPIANVKSLNTNT